MKAQWTELMQSSGVHPPAPLDADGQSPSVGLPGSDSESPATTPATDEQTVLRLLQGEVCGQHTTGSGVELVDNSALAIIDVTGTEAGKFLQSQVCNDLLSLPPGQSQITGYCTPKGRLLALFTVFALPSGDDHAGADRANGTEESGPASAAPGYRLVLPAGIVAGFLKRLRMFVMRSDVVLTEREDLVCVGLACKAGVDFIWQLGRSAGSGAADDEPMALPGPHTSAMAVTSLGPDTTVVRWHDVAESGSSRYLLIGPTDLMADLWKAQAPTAVLANHAAWRLADIGAGVPRIGADTLEAFVPQMVNLQLIDALSFRKGCYPGQEIVARMHYLGKLKRHMRRFRLTAPPALAIAPGSAVAAGSDANAGQVVDAIRSGDVIELLAVVKVAATDLHIGDCKLESVELPYTLPTQGDDIDAGLPPVEGLAGATAS